MPGRFGRSADDAGRGALDAGRCRLVRQQVRRTGLPGRVHAHQRVHGVDKGEHEKVKAIVCAQESAGWGMIGPFRMMVSGAPEQSSKHRVWQLLVVFGFLYIIYFCVSIPSFPPFLAKFLRFG